MSGVDGATKLNKVVAPKSKTTETESSVSEFQLQDKPTKPKEKCNHFEENVDIKKEFEKPVKIIKTIYEKVFSKSQNFKPEFGETVGDLIFYLSYKLKKINANGAFDKTFSLVDYTLPNKYQDGYIPLALKLASWCEQKGYVFCVDELLYEISSVFVKSAKCCGVEVNEDLVTAEFSIKIIK